ncbi:GIY-YIG nuclease family protein [Enterobacter bugandensis]|uniref:GIY-YIG nuclease family protein n=1 Tax=Enterobacter bugandensis TaxID=881260 RepID=UPI000F82086F|nr:GIY-YIG nuclease family protein [Enterobacter bugandensis]MCK7198922.1 GIY-YIG nuclease family protein [Enterobacter bugandensis]MCK7206956.1 GIY-YIG nuclease family protein [Enterobacter bugandensis]RTM17721.1 GIY-YIG nuclease family protein [Enterobacter bugandensis]HCM9597693.1 GIY-YIG nuclease family protein [Enterobacter bugandensis]HDC4819899.1 GIY-YIG nuclease family protein [Enterobacter bugandensis]
MARRKKDNNAAGIILVIIGVIAWGIYVAVRALINLNERFIESVSNPAGIIALFFGLLIAVALIIRIFMYRGFRNRTAELERAVFDLAQKEKAFEETVSTEVARGLYQAKKQLSGQWEEFHNARKKASRALQRIVDTAYKFKVKTLLSGTTVNNWQSKYDQLRKEREAYSAISEKINFLELEDNADWESVKQQFLDKVALLEKAQEEKEFQAELNRQMREEKQRQDELDRQQHEAEEEEQRLAEQQRLLEEALLAAEGAHREELERQRLELGQKIQDVHQQYERAKSMAQLTKQGHVYVISNIGSFGENVFKIGMTRRLEPMERVKELSGAAVPFDFDVHAMISCDDAPALEKTLHDHLESYRINRINLRKEFFRVELSKIIDEVERHHGQVEYIADPVALQYLQSLEYAESEAA